MTALVIVVALAGLALVVALSAVPEVLAAGLTVTAILFPYYALTEKGNTVDSFIYQGERIEPDAITVEDREDGPYVVTSPLPEYIAVDSELWEQAAEYTYDPQVDGDTGLEPPTEPLWLEVIQHADPEQANAGYVLHVDATNITLSYRMVSEDPDGTRLCQLLSWSERG